MDTVYCFAVYKTLKESLIRLLVLVGHCLLRESFDIPNKIENFLRFRE